MLDNNNYFVSNSNIHFERHLLDKKINVTGEWRKMSTSLCVETFEFGINEDDYICDQLIDRCYLSHLCWKFLEKKELLCWMICYGL